MRLSSLAQPLLIAWLLAGLLASAAPKLASAQTPDSTETAPADSLGRPLPDSLRIPPADSIGRPSPDSLGAAADSLAADTARTSADLLASPAGPPVGFARFGYGAVVGDSLPATRPALDVTELLADVPGAFVYRFGSPGWPDGWSPYGLSPRRVALVLDGRPFSDLVTGRPRYDLLPLAFVGRPRVLAERYGDPLAVGADVRPYDEPQPLTELRYLAGGTIQSVDALHAQQRRRALFGRPGVLGLLGAYSGRGADGAYPGAGNEFGTALRRMRRILGRLRYEQGAWSVELSNLYNARTVGAFGGVEPRGAFVTVYNPFDATLRNGAARRRTVRNDLALTARARLLPRLAEPLTASAYWTSQLLRYRDGAGTLETQTNRYGFAAEQPLALGAHGLAFRLEGWRDRLEATNALFARRLYGAELHATARDTFRLARTSVALEGGVHRETGRTFLAGSLRLDRAFGPLRLFARGASAGQPVAAVERYGYGDVVRPVERVPGGRTAWGEAGTSVRVGPLDLALSAFAHRTSGALDLYAVAAEADTVEALVSALPHRRAGIIADVGLRRRARRGFYLAAQATLSRFLNPDASPLHARAAVALPEAYGQARFGARYAPFRGDLDFDLYLLARFWSPMRSRTLHPPTGLLVLPTPDVRPVEASGTLDVYFETRVRDASIFLVYENALSGTPLLPGNLIVPVYPLPAQRFRFGVYWPISG